MARWLAASSAGISIVPTIIGGLLILSGALMPTARAEEVPLPPVHIFMQVSVDQLRDATKEIKHIPDTEDMVFSTSTAESIITAYAHKYGTPAQPLIDTLRCESDFNPNAVGDYGSSFGIAQIHLLAHADITKEEALDPLWSIDWAAMMFAAGHANLWSCYNKMQMPAAA